MPESGFTVPGKGFTVPERIFSTQERGFTVAERGFTMPEWVFTAPEWRVTWVEGGNRVGGVVCEGRMMVLNTIRWVTIFLVYLFEF